MSDFKLSHMRDNGTEEVITDPHEAIRRLQAFRDHPDIAVRSVYVYNVETTRTALAKVGLEKMLEGTPHEKIRYHYT